MIAPVGNEVTQSRSADAPSARKPRRVRHIRIETGAFAMDYQACAEQIADIMAELACVGLVVTVDDDVRPDLPPLPCGALWE
ncbi:hypothetical protein [Nocardia wallacei]|uniref:hypothetical protein n=1 Tax=Nocardia TaxID=1817 RepID=UPI00245571ED|nr:hypothetical protein [Nocardia wallacei]